MKTLYIEISDDVAHAIEVRAAMDDLTLKQGVELLLAELVGMFKEAREYEKAGTV